MLRVLARLCPRSWLTHGLPLCYDRVWVTAPAADRRQDQGLPEFDE